MKNVKHCVYAVIMLASVLLMGVAAAPKAEAAYLGVWDLPYNLSESMPVAAFNNANDSNYRDRPNSRTGRIIATYDRGEPLYCTGVVDTGQKYPWVRCVDSYGNRGFMWGQYISFPSSALNYNSRRAAGATVSRIVY